MNLSAMLSDFTGTPIIVTHSKMAVLGAEECLMYTSSTVPFKAINGARLCVDGAIRLGYIHPAS